MAASMFIVRCTYLSEGNELIAIDSKPLYTASAKRLLARYKRNDNDLLEIELIRWQHNCARPPSDGIRLIRRLDAVQAIVVDA